jgi:hypothetical protein
MSENPAVSLLQIRPFTPMFFGLYAVANLVTVVGSIVVFSWSPRATGAIVIFFVLFSLFSAGLVLSLAEPLEPLAKKSALFARLAWLARFLVAGVILVIGVLVAQAFGSLRFEDAISFAPTALVTLLLPLGLGIVVLLFLLDLGRIGLARRTEIVNATLRTGRFRNSNRTISIAASLIAYASNPVIVGSWTIFAMIGLRAAGLHQM